MAIEIKLITFISRIEKRVTNIGIWIVGRTITTYRESKKEKSKLVPKIKQRRLKF